MSSNVSAPVASSSQLLNAGESQPRAMVIPRSSCSAVSVANSSPWREPSPSPRRSISPPSILGLSCVTPPPGPHAMNEEARRSAELPSSLQIASDSCSKNVSDDVARTNATVMPSGATRTPRLKRPGHACCSSVVWRVCETPASERTTLTTSFASECVAMANPTHSSEGAAASWRKRGGGQTPARRTCERPRGGRANGAGAQAEDEFGGLLEELPGQSRSPWFGGDWVEVVVVAEAVPQHAAGERIDPIVRNQKLEQLARSDAVP